VRLGGTDPRSRSHALVAAIAAAAMALAVGVLPVAATSVRLKDPSVSPRTGTPNTTIVFEVVYENKEGSEADWVRVRIDGSVRTMTAVGGNDWRNGVRHRYSTKLDPGTYEIVFEAMGRDRFRDEVGGGTVTIAASPTPPPTPRPTPEPTPAPTPRPTATPQPTADPTATPAPTGTPGATETPGAGPGETPTASPTDLPLFPEPGDGVEPSGSADPSASPEPTDAAVVIPGLPAGGGSGGTRGDGSGTGSGGPGDGGSFVTTGGWTTDRLIRFFPQALGTTGAVTLAMAFLVFGKRRRDEEPTAPADVLAAAARSGGTAVASAALVPASPFPPLPGDVDAHLPRWRRPSLIEARKNDPLRNTSTSMRLRFDRGEASGMGDHERRRIRYRLVSLLDTPDEVTALEIGSLDEGDEVMLIERSGSYWRVLCPDGREGWLHKMTLGDVVIDGPSDDGPTTWTSADGGPHDGIDEDVLRAFLDSRRRPEF
jgi:hypothetical protein